MCPPSFEVERMGLGEEVRILVRPQAKISRLSAHCRRTGPQKETQAVASCRRSSFAWETVEERQPLHRSSTGQIALVREEMSDKGKGPAPENQAQKLFARKRLKEYRQRSGPSAMLFRGTAADLGIGARASSS